MSVRRPVRPRTATRSFWPALGAAVALGAIIRLLYVFTDARAVIGGDGYTYHADALRLGDGLGYTTTGFNGIPEAIAHHPPGWVTVLGVVSWLGGRSLEAHQLVGVAIGLGVVVVAGLVGKRYFSPRAGVIAALIAAVYPGFWVIEGNILAEPLGLLLVGVLTLMVFDLREKPTLGRSVAAGAMCGIVALARSEQLALLGRRRRADDSHRSQKPVRAPTSNSVSRRRARLRRRDPAVDDLQQHSIQGTGPPVDQRGRAAPGRELSARDLRRQGTWAGTRRLLGHTWPGYIQPRPITARRR